MTLRLHRNTLRALLSSILVAMAVVALPALATGKEARLPIQKEAWYAIKWNNQLVGYSRYSIERSVALGGDEFYVVNSDSQLRLGSGENNDIVFKAKTLLN